MDITYPPDAWERVGQALQARRGQLGYGHRQREQFVADRGGDNPPSVKTIGRLERGERTRYPPSSVTRFEGMYAVEAGSIRDVLEGGELRPQPGTPGGPPAPGSPRTAAGADPTASDAAWAEWRGRLLAHERELLGEAEVLFPGERLAQMLWLTPHATREERLELIRGYRELRAGGSAGERRTGTA